MQVVGYKYVRLYPPSESKHLKPMASKFSNNSSIDICEPNEAVYSDLVLGPGDMLYIPRWYWHYIVSLPPDDERVVQYRKNKETIGKKRKPTDGENNFSQEQNHSFVFSVSFWWGSRILKK